MTVQVQPIQTMQHKIPNNNNQFPMFFKKQNMDFLEWLKANRGWSNCAVSLVKSTTNSYHIKLLGSLKLFNRTTEEYYHAQSWGENKIAAINNLIRLLNAIKLYRTFFVEKSNFIFGRKTVETGEEVILDNLLPLNIRKETTQLAAQKWEAAGCPSGLDEKFWLEAENEIIDNINNLEV